MVGRVDQTSTILESEPHQLAPGEIWKHRIWETVRRCFKNPITSICSVADDTHPTLVPSGQGDLSGASPFVLTAVDVSLSAGNDPHSALGGDQLEKLVRHGVYTDRRQLRQHGRYDRIKLGLQAGNVVDQVHRHGVGVTTKKLAFRKPVGDGYRHNAGWRIGGARQVDTQRAQHSFVLVELRV